MGDKKLKRLYVAKRVVLVTVILYIAAFFVMNAANLSADNFKRFGFELKNAFSGGAVTETELTENALSKTALFKNGIVRLSPNSIIVYGKDFTKYSTHTVSMSTPTLRVSKNYILAFDRGGSTVSVYDSFKELNTFSGLNTVINAGISDDGHVFIVTEQYGYKSLLTVYDSTFRDIFKWESADHYLLDGIFSGKNMITVFGTDLSDTDISLQTYIHSINYSTAEQQITTLDDCMYVSAGVGKDGKVRVVTDAGLFSEEGKVYEFHTQVGKFSQSDAYAAFACVADVSTSRQTLTVVDYRGNIVFEKEFYEITDIAIVGDRFWVLASRHLYLLDKNGNELSVYETGHAVKICADSGNTVVIFSDRAQNIKQ